MPAPNARDAPNLTSPEATDRRRKGDDAEQCYEAPRGTRRLRSLGRHTDGYRAHLD